MDGLVFRIDGEEYVFDSSESLTMDEAIVLHDYSGLTLDRLDDLDGFNPKVAAAFMHTAIARKKPDLSFKQIRRMVGQVKLDELAQAFAEAQEDAPSAGPPSRPPSEDGESGKLGGNERSSGSGGGNGGDPSPDSNARSSTGSPV